MKIAHNMLLFFLLNMVNCELRCLCSGIQRALIEPDANFHFRRGGKAVLALCHRFGCELNSVTAFSDSHYHLLPFSSLSPNPCKSKPGLNSRSLISFSTCALSTKVGRSDAVLHFCSQQDLRVGCCIRSWFLSSK